MITKISIYNVPALSWDNGEINRQITEAHKEAFTLAEQLRKIHGILSFLNAYPEHDVFKAMGIYTTEKVTVKEYTKKKTTFSIRFLTITTELVSRAVIKPEFDRPFNAQLGREILPDDRFEYRYGQGDKFYLIVHGKEIEETSTCFDFIDV